MPLHSVVERSRMAFSVNSVLETAPAEAAGSAASWSSFKVGEPARPYVCGDRGGQSGTHLYKYVRTYRAS